MNCCQLMPLIDDEGEKKRPRGRRPILVDRILIPSQQEDLFSLSSDVSIHIARVLRSFCC